MLSGVIASSPLILQAHPAPKIARVLGGMLSGWLPNFLIDAPIDVNVSVSVLPLRI